MNALPLVAATGAGHGPDAVPTILLALAFVVVSAKLAGEVVERLGQPAVLGELLVGIVLGNAAIFGGPDTAGLVSSETFTVLAELGAVLLLFQVGLESTPKEMLAVGGPAARLVGSLLSPRLFRGALALRTRGVVLALSLGFCFVLSYLALRAGLAPIVGAFAAGLVLEEVHFEGQVKRGEPPLHQSLEPLIALLVPVFFVRMGMLVDVRSFASTSVLGFAALLTVAAVLGKLACALATPKGIPRLTEGLGMMPRGEVGLTRVRLPRPTVTAAFFWVPISSITHPPLAWW